LKFKDKPALLERLAAEYALGTLRGGARERFRRWMREDAALSRSVYEWQERLSPMTESVAPVAPPGRVWKEIEARLGPAKKDGAFRLSWRASSLWTSSLPRALGLVASGAVAAALFMTLLLPALQKPAGTSSYVAVLSDPRTQKPVLFVSAGRKGSRLRVKTLDPAIHVADASLELWALPKGGKPKSLGVLSGANEVLRLASSADQSLSDVPMLAVSLEPRGGSATGLPTGPVLYSGPCIKDW
jgi:anti-sigma-K factor RskA